MWMEENALDLFFSSLPPVPFTHALVVGLQEFLSQEQIAEYQGVFELFDKEKRGTLDFDALKAGMLAMSTNLESRFQFEQMGS
jgi:Ca2+-binding EF-hand superfamily protein